MCGLFHLKFEHSTHITRWVHDHLLKWKSQEYCLYAHFTWFFSFSFTLVTCDFQIMAKSVEYRCSFEYLFNAMREIVDAQWHCTFVCLNNIHTGDSISKWISQWEKRCTHIKCYPGCIDRHTCCSIDASLFRFIRHYLKCAMCWCQRYNMGVCVACASVLMSLNIGLLSLFSFSFYLSFSFTLSI